MAAGNSVMDEIREQHKKMKDKSLKEKFQYFWEYYRVATLVTILAIVFIGNLVYTVVTAKDSAFYAVFVNGYTDMDTEEYMAGFDGYAQIDTKNYSTTLETNFTLNQDSADTYSVANLQKFAAQVAAQEVDVMIADPDTFQRYTDEGFLGGLNEFLSEETLSWISCPKSTSYSLVRSILLSPTIMATFETVSQVLWTVSSPHSS